MDHPNQSITNVYLGVHANLLAYILQNCVLYILKHLLSWFFIIFQSLYYEFYMFCVIIKHSYSRCLKLVVHVSIIDFIIKCGTFNLIIITSETVLCCNR